MPTTSPWHGSNLEKIRYAAETVELYEIRFSARVTQHYEAFRERGCGDPELETIRQHALTQVAIKTIAERLRVLAEQAH